MTEVDLRQGLCLCAERGQSIAFLLVARDDLKSQMRDFIIVKKFLVFGKQTYTSEAASLFL